MKLWIPNNAARFLIAFLVIGGAAGFYLRRDNKQQQNLHAGQKTEVSWVDVALARTMTNSNSSFIPVDIEGTITDKASTLLQLQTAFEAKHPELEVTSSEPLWHSSGEYGPYHFDGLWIHHKPRPPK